SLSDAFAQANRATASYRRFIGHEQPPLSAINSNGHDNNGNGVIRPKTAIQPALLATVAEHDVFRPKSGNDNSQQHASEEVLIRPKNGTGNPIQNGANDGGIRPKIDSSKLLSPPTTLFDLFQQYEQAQPVVPEP
ncbi:MAG: hypothetical protein M9918_14950, partial [Anaerolineae bacterium]|nr:hypothetical protein [Anaerolineae bacterium]